MQDHRERDDSAAARPPRRWLRRSVRGPLILFLVLAAAATAALARCARSSRAPTPNLDCATAAEARAEVEAVLVCRREYERTRLPATGARLAEALRQSGDAAAATALASELLGTAARADALHVLGQVALSQRRLDDAARALEEARRLHRAQQRRGPLARDALALAQVQLQQHQVAEALQSLDECIAEARAGADAVTEGHGHLAAARALADAGSFAGAQRELDEARPRLPSERDQAWLLYEQGTLEQALVRGRGRAGHDEVTVTRFETALELARRARLADLPLALHLGLAYALAEIGRTTDAERHLAEAAALDLDGRRALDRARLAARVAYRRGDLAAAASIHERAWPALQGGDDRIAAAVLQARISLAAVDLPAAELWARRAAAEAEQLGDAQAVPELRPWVLAARREPLEVLFAVLARAGRAEDALAVFDRWQGRVLLDAMARPSPSIDLASTARKIAGLERWLPAASRAPVFSPGPPDARRAVDALHGIDLIGLAVAEGDVWRLTAIRGRVRIDRIGALDELGELPERFMAAPTDRALAGELGARLLPDDVVRATSEPLYAILDEPLAGLPIVALRRDGRPLIAARPVVRLPRLPAGACTTGGATGGATVLADAAGDLPDSRREAGRIASLLGATSRAGAAATSAALFAARDDRVLHLAVHGELDAGGGALRLRDRSVSALEIAAVKLGPTLVFVSACDPARSIDPELAGSLATAFLAGGASHVVATLRKVSGPGARELADRFYAAGGLDDPIRALARVQAELAETDDRDWPSLAVFGHDTCALGWHAAP